MDDAAVLRETVIGWPGEHTTELHTRATNAIEVNLQKATQELADEPMTAPQSVATLGASHDSRRVPMFWGAFLEMYRT